ncbi:hypothetical protein OKJ48_10935 [Streptomyces kunmingensis]|uniref:PH domain-containing protein n=1 Tax=Streptomyces kunmingensis TaxID=68225 RepID=A0ABU6C9B6_9ACTN|nr:hypothetical protein [Streptomyces kunmingensis]MEB3960752.1 hypothetical protein [Streptomyces kunmingensis]
MTRARWATAGLGALAAGLVVVPGLVAGPGDEPPLVAAVCGVLGAILGWLVPYLCVKIGAPEQADWDTLRCRTVTGVRTLDVASVRRVTGWREVRNSGLVVTVLAVTDSAGTRIGFSAEDDAMRRVLRAVAAQVTRPAPGTPPVRASRLALSALEVRPLPWGGLFLRTVLSVVRATAYILVGIAVPIVLTLS